MNVGEYKAFLRWSVRHNVKKPMCAVGLRGIGKSQVPQQVAREEGIQYIDLRLAQMEPGDIIGMPYIRDDKTLWAKPGWWPEPKSKGILVLEEYNRGTRDVRQAVFQLLTERKIGNHVLPDGWYIVGAINPDNGDNQVDELDEAWIRRFNMLRVDSDYQDWRAYSKDKINPNILGFMEVEKRFLNSADKFEIPAPKYNPASWYDWDEYLKAGILENAEGFNYFEVCAGLVGTEAALSFRGYMQTNVKPLTGEEVMKEWDDEKVRARFTRQKNDEVSVTIDSVAEYFNDSKRKWREGGARNMYEFWRHLKPEYKVTLYKKIDGEVVEKHCTSFPDLKPLIGGEKKLPDGGLSVFVSLRDECGVKEEDISEEEVKEDAKVEVKK